MDVNVKHYGIMGKSKIRHQLLQAGYADVPWIYKKETMGKMWNQDFYTRYQKSSTHGKLVKLP